MNTTAGDSHESPGLGSQIASLFAEIGLEHDIPELRSERGSLVEERETRLNALREALIAGENSGASTPFDFDAFVTRKRTPEPHGR